MNKQSRKNPQARVTHTVSFLDFWKLVAKNLGNSRLRIKDHANSIETLLAPNSDHREFLRDVIINSYFESDCCSIEDAVNINIILDVMGEAAYELQGRNKDDLMDIELLEEIAYLIKEHYSALIELEHDRNCPQADETGATIVNFSNTKIRRANAKL